MDEEKIRHLLIDFIDGKLSPKEHQLVQKAIDENEAIFREYDELRAVVEGMDNSPRLPADPDLSTAFYENLAAAKQETAHVRQLGQFGFAYSQFQRTWHRSLALRLAVAASLFLLGFFIDKQIETKDLQNAEIRALREEMAHTKNMVMLSLLKQESASQRIKAINYSFELQELDSQIVEALINTMNYDPNSNVRLAACEALTQFQEIPGVKAALIRSLPAQTDPNVQLTILEMIDQQKETEAVSQIQKLLEEQEVIEAVRNKAQENLGKLL